MKIISNKQKMDIFAGNPLVRFLSPLLLSMGGASFGKWNTAMLVGSGISIATDFLTNSLNIANSAKIAPDPEPAKILMNNKKTYLTKII